MRFNNKGLYIHSDRLRDKLDLLEYHLTNVMGPMLSDSALYGCKHTLQAVNHIIDSLDQEQKDAGVYNVDAVEVVRCKDCMKRKTCGHTRALGINGYCSDAERRAEDNGT